MKKLVYIMVLMMVAQSCARQGSLTGGAKDTTPPALDTLESTPNLKTQFNQQEIVLTFDEWVVLKDVTKEILISPPLDKKPTFTLRKKSVVVDFGEDPAFRPNTTYTINFGAAVRDLHEGNAAKDLRYVFSTGLVIDSLKVEGVVVDALTGEPADNITVMLYDVPEDSVILKSRPYYFAKTDKSGIFSIKNVKPGTFKAVAIDEGQASDLKWNPLTERIGFPENPVVLSDSLSRAALKLTISKNQGKVRTTDKNATQYGVVRVGWTDTPPAAQGIDIQKEGIRTIIENYKDTTLVWYDFPADTLTPAWSFSIGDTSNRVQIKAFRRNDFALRHRLRPLEESGGTAQAGRGRGGKPAPPPVPTKLPAKTIPLLPGRDAVLKFNFPIASVDTSKWKARIDTLPFIHYSVQKDSVASRNIMLKSTWKPGTGVQFMLLPGAITDFYGLANVDTMQFLVNVMSEKQLGGLNLTLENTTPGMAYVLEVLNGNNKELERRFTATGTEMKFQFKDLLAATYTLKLVEDANANGRWDTGSYFDKRQPELIFLKKLDALKPNWELEATMLAKKDDGKRK